MKMSEQNKGLTISDEVWMKVIQLVQLAMLTGVDVVDYMRLIRVKEENNVYVLGDGQVELFDKQLSDLMNQVQQITSLGSTEQPSDTQIVTTPEPLFFKFGE